MIERKFAELKIHDDCRLYDDSDRLSPIGRFVRGFASRNTSGLGLREFARRGYLTDREATTVSNLNFSRVPPSRIENNPERYNRIFGALIKAKADYVHEVSLICDVPLDYDELYYSIHEEMCAAILEYENEWS